MAGRINGKTADPVALRVMNLHNEIAEAVLELIRSKQVGDETEYGKVAMVALINVGAVYAVDSGISGDTFMQVAQINYAGAYEAAPKWS